MAYIPKVAKWFIADIVEEIRVSGYKTSSVHINTVLIGASTAEDALEKANAVGRKCNCRYKNVVGETVTCRFRGLRNLNVIHEALDHGAELTWTRRARLTAQGVAKLLTKKRDLAVFRPILPLPGPNSMPRTIHDELEKHGFRLAKAPVKTPLRKTKRKAPSAGARS